MKYQDNFKENKLGQL